VNNTARSARIPSLRTGIVAALRGGSRGGGGSGVSADGWIFGRVTAGLRMAGLFAVAVAATALFTLNAATAHAAATYQFSPARTEKLAKTLEEGTGAGYQQVHTLTFDAAGNLYLADSHGHAGESTIDKFDLENAFTVQLGVGVLNTSFGWGVAVDDETGHIFAAKAVPSEIVAMDGAGTELSRWTGAETPASTFSGSLYTAVDNSTSAAHGDVYVLSTEEPARGRVDVFASKNADAEEGEYLRSLPAPPEGFELGGTDGLAVDESSVHPGRVYVANPGKKTVDYFSPSGAYEGHIEGPAPGEPFGQPVGVAVDPATGDLFVADAAAGAIDRFSPSGAFIGPPITDHLHNVVSVAVQPTGPGAGDLYVADSFGNTETVDVFAIQRPAPPIVEATAATGVTGEAASLLAEVNPQGEATTYSLEYGPCPTAAPCPLSPYQPVARGTLGSAGDYGSHTVTAPRLTGLAASTTYHFRVVAANLQGQTIGEERTFTTQGAAGLLLPDGRGYELVSPPDKHGGSVEPFSQVGMIEAAADGSAISYIANAPTEAQPEGYPGESQVLSSGGPSGWASRVISSPRQGVTGKGLGFGPEYRFFAADLSGALVQPFGLFDPELSPEASEQTPYLRSLGSCSSSCYRPLLTSANTPPGTRFGEEVPCEEGNGVVAHVAPVCGATILGTTPDLSHTLLLSAAPLVIGAPQGSIDGGHVVGSLYEWSRSTGNLQLVSRLPENGAGEELPARPSGAPLGNQFGLSGGSARRAVSADGTRVYFNTEPSGGVTNLYLRDTEPGNEQTLELDLADEACLPPTGECESGGGVFQIASTDGSRVFFTDERALTANSGAGGTGSLKFDLYECRIVTDGAGGLACALTDLTPKAGSEPAGVQGNRTGISQGNVLGASEDGSYVYFAAKGVLASNVGADGTAAAPAGCPPNEGEPGTCNLYLAHEGVVRFIATLSGGDGTDWKASPSDQPTRVSPDGNWLAFMSQQPLTGYDNHDAVSGRPDAEIFLYDAASGSLRCASCDPTGARPVGIEYAQAFLRGAGTPLPTVGGQWSQKGWVAALVPQSPSFTDASSAYQTRWLSDSGRLFFTALGGLIPADSNGLGDVYEFEQSRGPGQPASNSCAAAGPDYVPASGACLDLISSGTGKKAVSFLDASESGDDVFFLTSQRLRPKDVDSANDIYDARVDGGEAEVIKPVECSGDACQQPAVPPVDETPGSLTFQGAGNVTECPKGQKLQKGKCVKQQPKKKNHKKNKHKNSKKGKKHKKSKRANSHHGGHK
jgi:DNA-binding beta-propeller fold protein YncE